VAKKILWLAALAAPWALIVYRLWFIWDTDPQYAYAWSVPPLALVLAAMRWRTQPMRPPRRELAPALLFASVALIFPMRLLQEAAPDWSVANWSLGLAATLATFLYLLHTGGWRWACWFLFPLLFLLTAIPWPQRFDLWLTQMLMRKVAAVTVEILGWSGVPAFRQGNLIRLPGGAIGIDEACSGIRSLQALLMASLFLGDLMRLPAARRFALLAAGLALAVAGNVCRTTLLSAIAARSGMGAVRSWHDPAGFSILAFGLAGTWLLARMLSRIPPVSPHHPPAGESLERAIPSLPALVPALLLLSLAAIECATQWWYASHERSYYSTHNASLRMDWPPAERDFRRLTVSDTARRILLFTTGDAAAWEDDAGRAWSAYHLVWAPGRTSTQSARMHRPETCLEATGAVLIREFGREEVAIPGGALFCREYLFQRDGAPLYVLFSLHEQQPVDRDSAGMLQDWSGWSRVQRALAGERNLGQESVEIAMRPLPGDTDPAGVMKRRLASLVSMAGAQRGN
jgi:exosortase